MIATATTGLRLGTALQQRRLAQHSHIESHKHFAAEQSVLTGWRKLLQRFWGLGVL